MSGKIEIQTDVCEGNGVITGAVLDFPRNEKAERKNESLTAEYQVSRDQAVLEKIITRNQGLLHAVLRRFKYFPDPYEDLLQVANLGLIKAVQRFDCNRGVGFSSYATALVDGEVRHYLRDNVLMRQPRWLRAAEKRIEDASIELNRKLKRPPTLKELALEVNISEEGILEILRVVASVGLHPVDDMDSHEGVNAQPDANVVRSLHYESFVLPIEDKIALQEALDALSSLHKKIVYLLFYKDLTQTQVARELGLSQRKVSRESAKALGRLKTVMNTKIF
ncbi:MAG: sigma-70 family RNA polymerase sigma factor [Thermoleophilia bacterium]